MLQSFSREGSCSESPSHRLRCIRKEILLSNCQLNPPLLSRWTRTSKPKSERAAKKSCPAQASDYLLAMQHIVRALWTTTLERLVLTDCRSRMCSIVLEGWRHRLCFQHHRRKTTNEHKDRARQRRPATKLIGRSSLSKTDHLSMMCVELCVWMWIWKWRQRGERKERKEKKLTLECRRRSIYLSWMVKQEKEKEEEEEEERNERERNERQER